MLRSSFAAGAVLCLALALPAAAQKSVPVPSDSVPQMLMRPAVSKSLIAFEYGGDIWLVPRAGGDARRLTAGLGRETDPVFSPDGSTIAFTGDYGGNLDVYVVPSVGGEPRRLTHHPGIDAAIGWTPDGKRVLFRSARAEFAARQSQLYTVSIDGGPATQIALPTGFAGSYSADGRRIAYMPTASANTIWKRYRGGTTTPIWLATLADASIDSIPRQNSNDFNPMWVGDKVYFLSDRDGATTLFAFDPRSRQVTKLVRNSGFDIKSAAATSDAIVYEQFGTLHLYDLASRQEHAVPIRVRGDIAGARPHWVNVGERILAASISPTGVRAAFEARGEILTVPVEKGDIRDLTNTSGAAERDPAWSPDGRWIAYFSDESGEYQLHVRDQKGSTVKKFDLGKPSFFYSPVWSPDSKKIAFQDRRRTLWYIDVSARSPKPVRVDQDAYDAGQTMDPSWSPDSRFLAYTRLQPNYLHAVFIRSLETGKSMQVTDGMSDARFPVFDHGGKYLFFTASTDAGVAGVTFEMSGYDRPVTRSVYVAVLRADEPSPLAPESDEEPVSSDSGAARAAKAPVGKQHAAAPDSSAEDSVVRVRVDADGIDQRILALPIPARDYEGMHAGAPGILFLQEAGYTPVDQADDGDGGPPPMTLDRFDLSKRKMELVLDSVRTVDISANGEKMLVRVGEQWMILPTAEPPKPGEGMLHTAEMQVHVDPRAEWKQIYHETWRIERDFFYDEHHHGLDLAAAERAYQPYVAGLASRAELTHVMEDMLGELTVGHLFISGGDWRAPKPVPGGLLGADYEIDNGRYRFKRIYDGENWNPGLEAPLTQPGVNVKVGDYLLAVNGRELRATDDVDGFFEGTAGKQVVIRVGPKADGTGARDVTVVPIRNEAALRNLAWIESNRRLVDSLSDGKVAYVYLPNTAAAGYTSFNRYFFSQLTKQGAVLDERNNGGGSIADYIVDYLHRPLEGWIYSRDLPPIPTPAGALYGPKVMLINESAGSGGDYMPWLFREAKVGPLIGTRTWGGLVGIFGYPELIDGGHVTAPSAAITDVHGDMVIENHGVAPDIQVELDPKAWRAGHDVQLERAVKEVLAAMPKTPVAKAPAIHYPVYQRTNAALDAKGDDKRAVGSSSGASSQRQP